MKVWYRATKEIELSTEEIRLLCRYSAGHVSRSQVETILDEHFDEGYIPGDELENMAREVGIGADYVFNDIDIFW